MPLAYFDQFTFPVNSTSRYFPRIPSCYSQNMYEYLALTFLGYRLGGILRTCPYQNRCTSDGYRPKILTCLQGHFKLTVKDIRKQRNKMMKKFNLYNLSTGYETRQNSTESEVNCMVAKQKRGKERKVNMVATDC